MHANMEDLVKMSNELRPWSRDKMNWYDKVFCFVAMLIFVIVSFWLMLVFSTVSASRFKILDVRIILEFGLLMGSFIAMVLSVANYLDNIPDRMPDEIRHNRQNALKLLPFGSRALMEASLHANTAVQCVRAPSAFSLSANVLSAVALIVACVSFNLDDGKSASVHAGMVKSVLTLVIFVVIGLIVITRRLSNYEYRCDLINLACRLAKQDEDLGAQR